MWLSSIPWITFQVKQNCASVTDLNLLSRDAFWMKYIYHRYMYHRDRRVNVSNFDVSISPLRFFCHHITSSVPKYNSFGVIFTLRPRSIPLLDPTIFTSHHLYPNTTLWGFISWCSSTPPSLPPLPLSWDPVREKRHYFGSTSIYSQVSPHAENHERVHLTRTAQYSICSIRMTSRHFIHSENPRNRFRAVE
jgi:hypothetical protein